MGYELHIVRRSNWEDDSEASNITLDEWRQYVDSDPELVWTENPVAGEDANAECEWTAHPVEQRPKYRPWFAYHEGAVDAIYPDEPTLRKMLRIAAGLGAKVQGDDLEFYNETMIDEVFGPPPKPAKPAKASKPWWRFW